MMIELSFSSLALAWVLSYYFVNRYSCGSFGCYFGQGDIGLLGQLLVTDRRGNRLHDEREVGFVGAYLILLYHVASA